MEEIKNEYIILVAKNEIVKPLGRPHQMEITVENDNR